MLSLAVPTALQLEGKRQTERKTNEQKRPYMLKGEKQIKGTHGHAERRDQKRYRFFEPIETPQKWREKLYPFYIMGISFGTTAASASAAAVVVMAMVGAVSVSHRYRQGSCRSFVESTLSGWRRAVFLLAS